ncbi:FtsB family cell division protein [Acetonema longum]|uniref:Septum formation initiator n=1 Tax=Acetonema longum DSM 6540 TaxID=1009370 RepID=F7NH64_9FIRM|nr:septum formation initiator family protein [Acetonema longum]EGO64547.1 hypothetical protein ALO_07048 [Acetonema longum DSM 6540]
MRRKYRINWFNAILVAFAAYFSYLIIGQQVELFIAKRSAEVAQAQFEQARQVNRALQEEKARLSNLQYIEKLAREDLGLVKPGEIPYIPMEK